jgi:hypothetical protein
VLAVTYQANAVEVIPGNFSSDGGVVSFDLIVSGDAGVSVVAEQITLDTISGPSALTLNALASEAVKNDAQYWLAGNSPDPFAADAGGGSYTFSDSPGNTASETVLLDDVVARFAFNWDGTIGDYTFTFDLDPSASFLTADDFVSSYSLQFPTGDWAEFPVVDPIANGFVLHLPVPEPATIAFFGLAGLAILRKRS